MYYTSLQNNDIDIYIYMRCRVNIWSKNSLFWVKTWSKYSLFFFFVFQKSSSFCRENEIFKKNEHKKKRKKHFFWVKTWSNFVAQHTWTKFWRNLGPSFDSTFLLIFGYFYLFEKCWNHYFYSVFSKNEILSPPQKLKEHYLWTQLR